MFSFKVIQSQRTECSERPILQIIFATANKLHEWISPCTDSSSKWCKSLSWSSSYLKMTPSANAKKYEQNWSQKQPKNTSLTSILIASFSFSFRQVNPMYNLVERVNDIYNSVIQSETCMERIACEVGGLAGDMGVRETARYFLRFKHPSHNL